MNDIVDAFGIGERKTRIGMVTFSSDAVLVIPMDRYYEVKGLKDAILSVKHIGGETNTGKALHVTRNAVFRKGPW